MTAFLHRSDLVIQAVLNIFRDAVVGLQEIRMCKTSVIGGQSTCLEWMFSHQRIHWNVPQRYRGAGDAKYGRGSAFRWIFGLRAGLGPLLSVMVTWNASVEGGRGGRGSKLKVLEMNLFVLFTVDVNCQHTDGLSHYEGEYTWVERPSVAVYIFFIFSFLVTRVSGITGDVNDDADDIAETWWKVNYNNK